MTGDDLAQTDSAQGDAPHPQAFDIRTATRENENYRTVVWTGRFVQVTLMSIPVGESIGLEVHPENDQFLRLDAGRGTVVMGPSEDSLDFERNVEEGWSIQVPAGTWHNVVNTGDEPLRLYTIYGPPHHAAGIVQSTKDEADRDEDAGIDEPPAWTEQL